MIMKKQALRWKKKKMRQTKGGKKRLAEAACTKIENGRKP